MQFDVAFFLSSLPRISTAALINLQLALVIFVCATAGGTALTIIRSLKQPIVNMLIDLLISFIRGTPLMIQIFLCYYALPAIGIGLPPLMAGILAISLNSAVFITEIMRGSLATIDSGQIEASTSLGLKPRHVWRLIILPQLFARILPMLVNEGTVIIKGTALLSIITVVEALRVAQQLGAANFRPFEPILAAALMFVALNMVLVVAGELAERRLAARRG